MMAVNRKLWRTAYRAFVLAFGVAISCDTERPLGLQYGSPAAMLIVGGQDQTGTVGEELAVPVRVRVVDSAGRPVPGQLVNFKVVSGGGQVFAGSALTSDSGFALERWTLGNVAADSQRLEARAVDQNTGERLVFGIGKAVAVHATPSEIMKLAGNEQAGPAGAALADSIAVRVVDRFGNPADGETVTWLVAGGGGTLSSGSSTTNDAGIARVRWTLGSVAGTAQAVTANVGSLQASFAATAIPGAATALDIQTEAQGAVVGLPFSVAPVIRVQDALGNTVSASTDAVTLSVGSGATVIGAATVSAVSGVATLSTAGLSGTLGTYTLAFSATLGGSVRTATQSITLAAGQATRYVVTMSASTAVVRQSVTVSAQLSDANGAPVATAGKVVTWSRTGGGTFSANTSTTNADGVATAVFTLDSVAGVTTTVVATDGESFTGQAGVASVAAPAARLAFTAQPANAGLLTVLSPTVRVGVQDQYGNPVATDGQVIALTWGANPSSANLNGSTATTVAGVAAFTSLAVDQPGSGYTLVANATGTSLAPATSSAFTVASVGTVTTTPAAAFYNPNDLIVLGDTIFFSQSGASSNGSLWKVSSAGGEAVRLTSGFVGGGPGTILYDGTYLDVLGGTGANVAYSSIYRYTPAGTPGTHYTTPNYYSRRPDLLFDGTSFYFVRLGDPAVASKTTGILRVRAADNDTVLVSTASARAIGLQGDNLLYAAEVSGSTWKIDRAVSDGSAFSTITTGPLSYSGRRAMLVVGGAIYWAEIGSQGATSGSIRSAPASGGPPTTRVLGLRPTLHSLTSDGTYLYLTDGASILRYRLSDFSATVIATQSGIKALTIAGTFIYWIGTGTEGTGIFRALR